MSKFIGLIMNNPSMAISVSTVVLAVATFCQVIFRDPYTRLLIKKETSKFNEVSYNFLKNAITFMDPELKVEERSGLSKLDHISA